MPDITLKWNPATGYADWLVGDNDLQSGSTLETAIIRSLFTDRRAPADTDLPTNDGDPRGCWSDTYMGYQIGSLLWTLERAKKVNATALLRQAEGFCTDALQWMIDAGAIATATASASWASSTAMAIIVTVTQPVGTTTRFNFQWLWNGG